MTNLEKSQKLAEIRIKLSTFGDIVGILGSSSKADLHNNLQNYLNNLNSELDSVDLTEEN